MEGVKRSVGASTERKEIFAIKFKGMEKTTYTHSERCGEGEKVFPRVRLEQKKGPERNRGGVTSTGKTATREPKISLSS